MQRPARGRLICAVRSALFAVLAAILPAAAQQWPVKPIRLVHGFLAGGNVDLNARLIAAPMGDMLGQQVIVEGRPGAGGTIAAAQIARAERDGYTVFLAAGGHASSPALYRSLPNHVAYRGGSATPMAVMAGEVPIMFGTPGEVQSLVEAGKLRVIAVTSRERWKAFPTVPTLSETVLPGFYVRGWSALAAPANLPAPVVTRLNEAAVSAMKRPDVIENFRIKGSEVALSNPDEAARLHCGRGCALEQSDPG